MRYISSRTVFRVYQRTFKRTFTNTTTPNKRERERETRERREKKKKKKKKKTTRVGDAMMMTTTLTTLTTLMTTTNPRAIPLSREKRNRMMTNQNQNQNETTTRKATTTTPKKKKKKKPFLLRMPRVAKGALSLMACATITLGTQNPASASSSFDGKQHFDDRDENYIENIAGSVSSSEGDERKPTLTSKVRGKNKKKIERCTGQCVTTCVRGSFRSTSGPGLGPATILKEPFVFKDGFRSRRYCVEECLDYCALTMNKADVART